MKTQDVVVYHGNSQRAHKFIQSFTPGSCLPFAGCVTRLAPSPCTRLSRARSTMSQSDFPSTFSLPPFAVGAAYLHKFDLDSGLPLSPGFPSRGSLSVGLIVLQELMGPLKFSTPLLLHARRLDPGRPSSVSPNRRLRVGFRLVNNVATCSDAFNEAHFASGWCGHPSGLRHTLSTLHRCCSPVLTDPFHNHRSASSARLNKGGGLALTLRRLSPRQKRQASLDAHQRPSSVAPATGHRYDRGA
jgi:hypothetical protein